MSKELLVKAVYSTDAGSLFERASNFSDLIDATSKISTYYGLPAEPMKEGKTYTTDIRIFGIFRCDNYNITIKKVCSKTLCMESFETNEIVQIWSHRLQIQPTKTGAIWIDHVIMHAGARTPIVSRYAKFMYQHRHKMRGAESVEATLRTACRSLASERPVFYPAE